MHLAERGYFLIALTGLLAIIGIWSDDASLQWSWCWPALLLCLGLALEAWLAPRIGLHAELAFEQRLLLGRSTSAVFRLRNDYVRAVTIQYARVLPAAMVGDQTVVKIRVPAGAVVSQRWLVRPARLGPGTFSPLPARLLGRLGFAWWSDRVALQTPFSVAPDALSGSRERLRGDARGEAALAAPGHGSELFQLRAYRPGDPFARIDWKASARARELISREMSADRNLAIVLVIDAGRMSRMAAGQLDRLGLAANIAARFAEQAVRIDDRVGLIAYSDRVLARCAPDRGRLAVRRIRDALERLVTDGAESQPTVAAQALAQTLRSRSLIVWLADFDDPANTAALHAAVAPLLRRHVVICAAVDSESMQALVTRPARNWRDPYIALAAGAELERIGRQAAALRGAGALVVRASEQDLESAVLRAYRERRRLRQI